MCKHGVVDVTYQLHHRIAALRIPSPLLFVKIESVLNFHHKLSCLAVAAP